MARTIISLLYFCLLSSVSIWAQNPIGLRASSYLRGIPFGAEAEVENLRNNVDNGQYNQKLKDNYELIVIGKEVTAQHLWTGEHIYNFTDADFFLGATPNTTGWAQQNGMQTRAISLVRGRDERIPNWLLKEESTITSDKAKQLLSDYVHAVVGRYQGKIRWWNVVNEAINDINTTNPFNL
jgi:endo-1,4-beta-xylanase